MLYILFHPSVRLLAQDAKTNLGCVLRVSLSLMSGLLRFEIVCVGVCLSDTSNLYTSFLSMGMDSKDMLLRALECLL